VKVLDVAGRSRVVIVGHGQLGSAVASAIAHRADEVHEWSHPTAWMDADATRASIAAGLEALPPSRLPVTVVWSAGRCGMSSSEADCEESLATMRASLDVLAGLGPRAIHLLGSVGALALGHPRWSGAALGVEVPYARLKLAEEALVAGGALGDPVVHRVSSVYGPPGRPGRQGMITVLVLNASQLRTTRIFGRWSTLRNYVHADDVAAFVADRVLLHAGPGVHVLAAPRSHAIAELVAAVGTARRRPVPIHLVPSDNAEDLTLDPAAIHPAFRARPLDTAIRQMVLELRQVPIA